MRWLGCLGWFRVGLGLVYHWFKTDMGLGIRPPSPQTHPLPAASGLQLRTFLDWRAGQPGRRQPFEETMHSTYMSIGCFNWLAGPALALLNIPKKEKPTTEKRVEGREAATLCFRHQSRVLFLASQFEMRDGEDDANELTQLNPISEGGRPELAAQITCFKAQGP